MFACLPRIPQPALQAPTLKFSRKLSIMSETLVNLKALEIDEEQFL
jgi:hypothetical protein